MTTEPSTDWGVCVIDTDLDSRAVTFENPTGERGAGGLIAPNETLIFVVDLLELR